LDDFKGIIQTTSKMVLSMNPVTSLILEATEQAINNSSAVAKKGDLEEMKNEAMRQEISLKMAKEQAKVSQEIAIARRIETAEEVTIEEYYDYSGEGGIGLKSDGKDISLGINGSGKNVTKRVYTFKGWHNDGVETTKISNEKCEATN
jgi:hypothetical protein